MTAKIRNKNIVSNEDILEFLDIFLRIYFENESIIIPPNANTNVNTNVNTNIRQNLNVNNQPKKPRTLSNQRRNFALGAQSKNVYNNNNL